MKMNIKKTYYSIVWFFRQLKNKFFQFVPVFQYSWFDVKLVYLFFLFEFAVVQDWQLTYRLFAVHYEKENVEIFSEKERKQQQIYAPIYILNSVKKNV